jgi:predicted  nucleic acid-binding Zn-ribbon protein
VTKPANLRAVGAAAATPPRTPERATLAAAIARHDAARRRLAAVDEAIRNAGTAVFAAREHAEKAEAAITAAKEANADYLTRQALGEAGSPPQSIKAARAIAVEANDALDVARQTEAALAAQREPAKDELHWAEQNLTAEHRGAVKADDAVARLLRDYADARRRFEELVAVVGLLAKRGMLPPGAERPWNLYVNFDAPLPADSPWHAALDALARDADAPLPTE